MKTYYVGVSVPYFSDKIVMDIETNKDWLSPDLLASRNGKKLPLVQIEANNKKEAKEEYLARYPYVKDIINS